MGNWKDELKGVFEKKATKAASEAATVSVAQKKVEAWMQTTARPALEEPAG